MTVPSLSPTLCPTRPNRGGTDRDTQTHRTTPTQLQRTTSMSVPHTAGIDTVQYTTTNRHWVLRSINRSRETERPEANLDNTREHPTHTHTHSHTKQTCRANHGCTYKRRTLVDKIVITVTRSNVLFGVPNFHPLPLRQIAQKESREGIASTPVNDIHGNKRRSEQTKKRTNDHEDDDW